MASGYPNKASGGGNFDAQHPEKGSVLLSPMDQEYDNETLGGIPVEITTMGISAPDSIGLTPSKHKTYKSGKK